MIEFFDEFVLPVLVKESFRYVNYVNLLEYLADFEDNPSLHKRYFLGSDLFFCPLQKRPLDNASFNFFCHLNHISELVSELFIRQDSDYYIVDDENFDLKKAGSCMLLSELASLIEDFLNKEIGVQVDVQYDGMSYSYPQLWICFADHSFDITTPQSLVQVKRLLKHWVKIKGVDYVNNAIHFAS